LFNNHWYKCSNHKSTNNSTQNNHFINDVSKRLYVNVINFVPAGFRGSG